MSMREQFEAWLTAQNEPGALATIIDVLARDGKSLTWLAWQASRREALDAALAIVRHTNDSNERTVQRLEELRDQP